MKIKTLAWLGIVFLSAKIGWAANLSQLTPVELKEYETVRSAALRDPAVQSTRRITRIALHKAMLKADPTVDTIFANMNAHVPKNQMQISQKKKHFGMKFSTWLSNYPKEALAALTPDDLKKLEAAHQKGLQDPTVIAARKTARITMYNAMINADPKIIPVLTKAGIKMPNNVRWFAAPSKLGSEEQILGGNEGLWDADVLTPAVEKMQNGNTL